MRACQARVPGEATHAAAAIGLRFVSVDWYAHRGRRAHVEVAGRGRRATVIRIGSGAAMTSAACRGRARIRGAALCLDDTRLIIAFIVPVQPDFTVAQRHPGLSRI